MPQEGIYDEDGSQLVFPRIPEWPVSATRRLSKAMQQRFAQALLSLPEDAPAAKAAGITGFVPAGDYTTVSEVMKLVGPR
ncbi:MAG: phosphate/phosphite/phosphonate ABC transporter substrate-binding protein [Deltaproteobacteria bacterium]